MRAPFSPCVRMGDAMGTASICPDRRLWRLARLTSPSGRAEPPPPPNCRRPSTNRVVRVVPDNAGKQAPIPTKPEVVGGGLSGDMIGSVSSLVRILIPERRNAEGYRHYPAFRNNEGNLEVP